MQKKIKALVVDDSAFMRKSLSMMLESTGEIEVIATARDGQEGVEMANFSEKLATLPRAACWRMNDLSV